MRSGDDSFTSAKDLLGLRLQLLVLAAAHKRVHQLLAALLVEVLPFPHQRHTFTAFGFMFYTLEINF